MIDYNSYSETRMSANNDGMDPDWKPDFSSLKIENILRDKLTLAIKTLELIAQDPFNGLDGEPDPMKVILRMRVDALNALEKLK